MEGRRGQKPFKGTHEIQPCQHTLFVRVNVTTHTAANEIGVCETIFAHVMR